MNKGSVIITHARAFGGSVKLTATLRNGMSPEAYDSLRDKVFAAVDAERARQERAERKAAREGRR